MATNVLMITSKSSGDLEVKWNGLIVPFVIEVLESGKRDSPWRAEAVLVVATREARGENPNAPLPIWRKLRKKGIHFIGWPTRGDPECPAINPKHPCSEDDPAWRLPEAEWKCACCDTVFPYGKVKVEDCGSVGKAHICPACSSQDIFTNDPDEWEERAIEHQKYLGLKEQAELSDLSDD